MIFNLFFTESITYINIYSISYYIIEMILIIIPLMVGIAFLTLLERKIIGSMQQRRGPNVTGFLGLMQAVADGIKLVLKETTFPSLSNAIFFIFAPYIVFSFSLLQWVIIPIIPAYVLINLDFGIFFLLIFSTLNVYGIILAGWSSNSRYALLGSIRAAAQMLSYEICIGIIILNICIFTRSFNLIDIVEFQNKVPFILSLFPVWILFFISALVETNRTPFDLPEAEGELVAGYNVEYSALMFALFFLAEYGNIILMSALNTILFLGGWNIFGLFSTQYLLENEFGLLIGLLVFSFKTMLFLFLFIWIRAALPRFRYDQLMSLGWKVFLPISLSLFFINCIFNYIFII